MTDRPTSSRPAATLSPEQACLAVFQDELVYIYRTLRRLGAAPTEIEDLCQDMFLALWHSWSNYDPTRPVRPYLFGIAFRIVAAHQRKRRREVPMGFLDLDDPCSDPSEPLETKKRRALLLTGLERIPLSRRAVLIMHELDELPVAEVAATLKIPLFTVYSRLRTGRLELEAALRRLLKSAPNLDP